MGKNVEHFRKRHQKRKAMRKRPYRSTTTSYGNLNDVDRGKDRGPIHPLFSKEKFFIKVFLSIVLFLAVAILFKQPSDMFVNVRQFVTYTFEQDFKFASVAAWYERKFGKPLALLPDRLANDDTETVNQSSHDYAVPVTGKIIEPFNVEKKGIMLETGVDATIESVQDGFVVFVGERENLNKTVIVQHQDGSESWYGNLESVDVALYDYIKSGHKIGKALKGNDGESGMFFFALKQGESFIDPIQVMSFD
ncbi:peptidoglycan DD-metalloendopeptidase family protein [Pueribacillus sp. YX66]|uniref:peptidoglycan DD-metalloendopeptidase family protein n=1 Tax=Pueribacillus sp. YX66 TaxID=3229242 RepID=UPI00358D224B